MNVYVRKRNKIFGPDGYTQMFPSISQAKKKSRELQKQGHKVELDHSDDPKPKPLHFKRYGSRRDAADRFIRRREREDREKLLLEKKKARGVVMSKSELRRLGVSS